MVVKEIKLEQLLNNKKSLTQYFEKFPEHDHRALVLDDFVLYDNNSNQLMGCALMKAMYFQYYKNINKFKLTKVQWHEIIKRSEWTYFDGVFGTELEYIYDFSIGDNLARSKNPPVSLPLIVLLEQFNNNELSEDKLKGLLFFWSFKEDNKLYFSISWNYISEAKKQWLIAYLKDLAVQDPDSLIYKVLHKNALIGEFMIEQEKRNISASVDMGNEKISDKFKI